MVTRIMLRSVRQASNALRIYRPSCNAIHNTRTATTSIYHQPSRIQASLPRIALFHTQPAWLAQSPTADEVMETLNELYATAKDEFEIASEETEKKTVYASDDREAAREALTQLKEAFDRASKETAPEVAKEVQGRVGSRIRELESAITAMEERAMHDD